MRRFTKIGRDRTGSLSRKEKSSSKRHRSISATVSTSALPVPTSYDLGGRTQHQHQFHLCYLGYVTVDEPRNPRDISAAVRNVMATTSTHKKVTISYRDGVLTVSDENDDRLILAPFQHVAIVTQDNSRNSYPDNSNCCIVVGFNNGRYKNQSHVFQAKSNREASDIVQALQKAFKASKGSTKSRKASESSSTPKAKVEGQLGMGRRLNAMEDEDELIEHKPINSARRDSKRTIPNLSRVSSEGVPSSLPIIASPLTELPSPLSAQTTKKKSGTRKSVAQRASEKVFTAQNKAEALLSAIEKIVENNNLLREKCRVLLTPNTTFEEALITMKTGNTELLSNYLSSGRINADSADGSRNTLLHYAVAIGNIDIIRTICNGNADMEAAGWSDCRPLHRAIAEGNISVLQVLLQNGAQVNGLDIMKRTPLHISSGKRELNECSIALVEQGAHIMATDVLGLRPYDLNPALKEIQNRLVASACESFVTAKLKEEVSTHPSAGLLATPHSLSPSSSRPSSVASGNNHIDGCDLDTLVGQVSLRAQLIAQAHKNKLSSRQPMSRSFANISELQNSSAESAYRRACLQQFKFSSECGLHSELEGSAQLVIGRMDKLIHESKRLERRGQRRRQAGRGEDQGEEPEDQWEELDMELSLSEPNLVGSQDSQDSLDRNEKKIVSPTRRPFSSAAILQCHSLSHPLSKVRANSGTSQSSTGTLIEDEEVDGDDIERASQTMGRLERDGDAKQSTGELMTMSEKIRHQPLNTSQPDASPGDIRRQERNLIFDELISQLNEVSEELDHPLSPSSGRRSSSAEGGTSSSPEKRESQEPEMIDTFDLDEISEVVDMDDVIDADDSEERSGRPTSTISEQTDMFSSLPRPPQPRNTVSRTVSLSSATLPNKKTRGGKWLQRVGSPLLKSRKSFTTGSPNSKRRGNKIKELKEEGEGEERGEMEGEARKASEQVEGEERKKEKGSRRLFARKRSLPEIHNNSTSSTPATTPTFQRTSSSDNFPHSEASVTSFDNQTNQSNQLSKQQQGPLLSPPLSHQPPPTRRVGSRQGDPVANSLDLMVTLSRNKECLSTLVSYICMPKCETRLRQLSQDAQTNADLLKNIATLMTNIFEAGGTSDGKKTALQSGVLDLTIKLLQGRDPIPGTCLSLLNGLLVSEDDSDFLRTIIRIPSKPLLHYLEPVMGDAVSESDSGCGNLRRDALMSATAHSSSDASNQVTQDEGVASVGPARLEVPVSAIRTSSINSEFSESSYSGRNLASPTLQGSSVTNLEARRIVLKMLAVSSTHSKMQNELSNERALSLLADVCNDPSHENLTNGLITLANVAQNVASHELFFKLGLVEKFHNSLVHGPRPRYHASRALVYLGRLEMLKGISLFEPIATGYETDVMIQTTDSDGHEYARGATIEKCVEMLTDKLSLLWGGFSLAIGPLSPSTEKITPKATKEQTVNFFLTMYKTFVHPLVFVRLLRHRLAHPDTENLFDWSAEDKSSSSPSTKTTPTSFIPPEQLNVFKLIGRWMEAHPEDFVKYPLLQSEVEQVISRLRLVRGAYLPHTHRLKSLLQDVNRAPSETAVADITEEKRDPHHENLYKLCKQMVTGGHLPVTSDEAVYLGSLQMHIEELALSSQDGGNTGSLTKGRKATSRIKSAFPPGYTKSKQLVKRIQSQIQEFDKLSDRNSKHQYIERCQGNPGYDCTFFSVRVPSGGRFKKSGVSKQLLGISSKKVVFLHEKTKDLLLIHPLASVLNVTREPESSTLIFTFRGDMTEFKVQVDSPAHAWEMVNVLEQCKGDRMSTEEAVRWSESLPSLFTMSVEQRLDHQDSASEESSNERTDERGTTPPGPVLSNDALKSASLDPDYSHLEPLSSNGLIDSTPSHKHYHGDMLGKEPSDDVSLAEERTVFCDCPPDPELPQGFNLQHIILIEMLSCPLEVARQMTLIAHERFCAITPIDLLEKVNLIPKRSSKVIVQRDSRVSNHSGQSLSLSFSDIEQQETNIEKLAYRFNQVGNWVANCILQFETVEERSEIIDKFISIAQHCFELRNYGSVMAIVVAGLGSAPIRRLHQSWAGVQKERRDLFKEIDTILDSKSNYKRYRESLGMATTPCVPYVGVFLKDLTFICDGNPDYLRGGLINLHKRRQVYKKLQEVHHFQQDHYKLHHVPELSQYLLSHRLVAEDDLHSLSQSLEPRIKRSQSQTNTRVSSTGSQKGSFFKSISGRSSVSSSNLNKV